MLKPDRLFSDGMVLQQGQAVPVWGLASPGAPVTVTMQGRTAHATANAQGRWQALCGPFADRNGKGAALWAVVRSSVLSHPIV